jgi:hypothetical protein
MNLTERYLKKYNQQQQETIIVFLNNTILFEGRGYIVRPDGSISLITPHGGKCTVRRVRNFFGKIIITEETFYI